MNQESHWNRIAHSYDQEIFDVFASDKKKVLPGYFKKHANRNHLAIDFGAGTGKAFPFLSPAFKKVLAIDISDKCLHVASNRNYPNVEFQKQDLTEKNIEFPAADFLFCCNVIILPEPGKNHAIIRNAHRALKKNGRAVFIMPSLDSILFYAWRLIDWYRKEGTAPHQIPASELEYFSGTKEEIFQGLVRIDNVITKHYSYPEIHVVFREAGFTIEKIDKVEYEWTTEFASPPAWLKDPYPWDWLVECKA